MSTTNVQTKGQLLDEYTAALTDYFKSAGEAPLERAYDIGRRCLTIQGMGIVEILEFHEIAVGTALRADFTRKDFPATFDRATRFLTESLAPFEMAHRAYREQVQQRTTEIEALNRLFQRHLKERFATLQKYRDVVGKLGNLAQEINAILDLAQTQGVPELQGQQGIDAMIRTLENYRAMTGRLQILAQEISAILDFAQTADVPELRGQEGIDATLGDPGRAHQ